MVWAIQLLELQLKNLEFEPVLKQREGRATCERGLESWNWSVALNRLSQVTHCTNSVPLLSEKVPECPGRIKMVLHLVGLRNIK